MEVLILTKSAKHHQYCVAGIDLKTNEWVRLVSDDERTMFALTRDMIKYQNHRECEVLDVVNVPIIERRPLKIQKENVLIDKTKYWELVRKADISEIEQYLDCGVWIYDGERPYIRESEVGIFNYSLVMYKVNNLVLSEHENNYGQKRRKVSFKCNNVQYENWSMTDYEYYNAPLGELADEAIIVVSIPEDDYNGNYYKFVAKIFLL